MPSLVRAEAFHTPCGGCIAAKPAAVLDPRSRERPPPLERGERCAPGLHAVGSPSERKTTSRRTTALRAVLAGRPMWLLCALVVALEAKPHLWLSFTGDERRHSSRALLAP